MATAFRGGCDTCGFTATRSTRVEAQAALNAHTCQQRCSMCGFLFALLVDGMLCISCDSLLYPHLSIVSPVSRRIA